MCRALMPRTYVYTKAQNLEKIKFKFTLADDGKGSPIVDTNMANKPKVKFLYNLRNRA